MQGGGGQSTPMEKVTTPAASSGADFEQMFELAPVSLWLEDYSALKRLFEQWRAEGVTDMVAHVLAEPGRIAECTAGLKVLQVNRRTLEVFAAPNQEELVNRLGEVFRDEMFEHHLRQEMLPLWNGELGFSSQTVNYALDGRRLDVQVNARVLKGYEDTWERVMVSLEDITERVRTSAQLAVSEQYSRDLFEYSPVSLWVEDFQAVKRLLQEVRDQGIEDFPTFIRVHPEFVTRCMHEIRVINVNQQTLRMFGAPSKEVLLNRLGEVFRGEMHDSFAEQLRDLWDGKTVQQREVVNYSLSGDLVNIHMQFSVLPQHLAHWDLVLVSLVDITARKKAEAYLEYLGKHDALTQLRNRAFYTEELNRLQRKGPWPLSIVIADLNGLKTVNDEQGHAAGDAMLRRVGEVLAKAVDSPACAARVGGDEFAVLLPGADERAAKVVMERVVSILELNNQFYPGNPLSLAMGAATCEAGNQIEAALNQADQAMYAEKARFYRETSKDRRQTLRAA